MSKWDWFMTSFTVITGALIIAAGLVEAAKELGKAWRYEGEGYTDVEKAGYVEKPPPDIRQQASREAEEWAQRLEDASFVVGDEEEDIV